MQAHFSFLKKKRDRVGFSSQCTMLNDICSYFPSVTDIKHPDQNQLRERNGLF